MDRAGAGADQQRAGFYASGDVFRQDFAATAGGGTAASGQAAETDVCTRSE
ncbi:hypothetical protein SDC9_117471 [bioreactor metagenome]|uniref:Uncharacterized protein n=1 Tax=bioreactor metagenome TaxID=1076179 RepID=A0A645BYB2_9ZZZZ